ncbi:ArnT family glycosyltransferase [Microscilla marina]|uniref:Membrane protein, putative n=1 Tax=Microscilla marina ATCC 23134 TaxID=313606 RepID=A1ZDW3_MICM2|nr:glycosyltransferase family 39 protein [Microscilla marina]EAY31271.1 membrane protein, putative [Microscilla marina ATCC 23134]
MKNNLKITLDQSPKNAWWWVLIALFAVKLFIHLWAGNQYGFHRDELLYLVQGHHLSFGYMEVPPVTAWLGRLARTIGGDSLLAMRTLTALAGLCTLWLTVQFVRKLGGSLFAQVLAVVCILASPAFYRHHTLFQPVVFDQLCWLLVYYFLLHYLLSHQPRYLLWMGAAAGVGMLTKYNMLFCVGGIVLAMFATNHRKLIASPWVWAALGVSGVILLPNIFWQYQHDFPVMDHFKGLYKKQLQGMTAGDFLLAQLRMHQYITAPVWLLGLWYFLQQKSLRWLGGAYLATLGLFIIAQGQAYYFNGVYPLMFAGGAVFIAQQIEKNKAKLLIRPVLALVIFTLGMVVMPYGTPFLTIDQLIKYTQALDINPITPLPNGRVQNLTSDYADMFGWREQVKVVADTYTKLSKTEQEHCLIWGENYGEAGALHYLGKPYGLPPAISVHGSFYLWGAGNPNAQLAITVGLSPKDMRDLFEEVTLIQRFKHPYAIDEEHNIPILLCRRPKQPLGTYWKKWRKYVFS